MLRNTEHVYGIVIYTGHESKVRLMAASLSSHLNQRLSQPCKLHHCARPRSHVQHNIAACIMPVSYARHSG